MGTQPSHIVRDLFTIAEDFGLLSSGAKPYQIQLSTGHKAWIFLPHEIVFHSAMTHPDGSAQWALDPAAFASDRGLGRHFRDWANHPDVGLASDVSQVGIGGIHGDGAIGVDPRDLSQYVR